MAFYCRRAPSLLGKPRAIPSQCTRPFGPIAVIARPFSISAPHRNNTNDAKVTDRMTMQGRNVLVTGGGRGIGFAICKAVAQMGGNIAVLDALKEPVDEFHTLKEKYGTKTFFRTADVTDENSLTAAFDAAVSELGTFHGCVPAAGIALDKPLVEHQWAESKRVLMVNTMGTFWTVKLMVDHMIKQGVAGSIVMIASIAAQGIKVPEQNISIYNMSKAAVKGAVGPLAVELSEFGIRVNSISPGVIMSPMTNALKTEFPKLKHMFENAAPAGRIGVPEDLTPAVIYLLSDVASFTTGTDLIVSGGFHAGVRPSWMHRAMPE